MAGGKSEGKDHEQVKHVTRHGIRRLIHREVHHATMLKYLV